MPIKILIADDHPLIADGIKNAIEKDVQFLVDSAKQGDLSVRIALADKSGCYEKLSSSINDLVSINEEVVDDTVRVLSAMSKGDLTQQIERDYSGAFKQLKDDANQTTQMLRRVIEGDIQALIDAAKSGDLSKRIDLEDKNGFFNSLSSGINELVKINEQVTIENDIYKANYFPKP